MQDDALHIAVAVIFDNSRKQVLLSKRPDHVHQGGLWEFPGGKCENEEAVENALSRELNEELGLVVDTAESFIQVEHSYPEYRVLLDVWCVYDWHGDIHGREGQQIEWVPVSDLEQKHFPVANEAIVKAVKNLE